LVRLLLRVLVFPLGRCLSPPSDHIGHQIATLLMQPGAARDRLTAGIYIPTVHGKDKAGHARFPHLGPSLRSPLPQAGEETNESLREFYIYDEQDAVGALEAALASTLTCEPLQIKLQEARKAGKLNALEELLRIAEARDQGFISAEQALQLERDYALRRKVIMVDDFAPEQLRAVK